jgi:hypothetical protein
MLFNRQNPEEGRSKFFRNIGLFVSYIMVKVRGHDLSLIVSEFVTFSCPEDRCSAFLRNDFGTSLFIIVTYTVF